MNFLNFWKSFFLPIQLGFGGGGGGGAPTTSTTNTSNLPEYVKPYVENMLSSAQSQIYNDDMTTFRPYQAYSANPNDYVAGFSPLQQQAQQTVSNMQVPGQFGQASGLAGMSGMGQAGLGMQAAGAGQQFANQATSPMATQAYMSPYMQNVVDYQKSQALRDYQLGQPKMQAAAVGQGAFGGNRLALQQSEAQRNLMGQLQGIQATGSQEAFKNAQAQQQFGAQLGLQGLQAGMTGLSGATQAASTLGSLGQSQLAGEQSIANLQAQQGLTQQQQEQQKINQAIQDYATAQQYPFMQLSVMNSLLRGLPLQSTTTQSYQAAPSTASQLAGLGLTGAAAYGLAKKKGGMIEEKKGSGLAALELNRLMSKKS